MQSETSAEPNPKWMFITGWIVSVLPSLLFIFSGIMKLTMSEDVAKGFEDMGFNRNLALYLGILEIACTIVYLNPGTAVLGAILLTGYMGGAIVTHLRVGDVFFMQVIIGMIVWLGMYLRDARLRALIPWRS